MQMVNPDPEIDIYKESGPEFDQVKDIDYEFISKDQTEGVLYFHNSNTVHECRFHIISTSTQPPAINLEVILTEQMIQVNDLNTKSIYADELNLSGLIQNANSEEEPTCYWLYLKSQVSPMLMSKMNLTLPSVFQISIWIGTGKVVTKDTMIYRKTLPIFGENGADVVEHQFPLNIRNTSRYSYMNIIDMPPVDLPTLEIPPTSSPSFETMNHLYLLWGFKWNQKRRRNGHPIFENILRIMDKTTIQPN
jgi:hypothetical protein